MASDKMPIGLAVIAWAPTKLPWASAHGQWKSILLGL